MGSRTWYQVNEIFTSIQGEGILVGSPATFIRLQGCPVGCPWCDSGPLADDLKGRLTNGLTRNTWGPGGERMTVNEIVAKVDQRHVIITGGEPTIWDLDSLINAVMAKGCFVQLETSGYKDLIGIMPPNHITISPKENLGYQMPPGLRAMAAEIKWVVDDNLSYDVIYKDWKKWDGTGATTVLMPEGCPPTEEHTTKAMAYLERFSRNTMNGGWILGQRLQYQLGLR